MNILIIDFKKPNFNLIYYIDFFFVGALRFNFHMYMFKFY